MRLIPAPYRILALVLLVLACIAAGIVAGLSIESNRRDAIELAQKREADKAFQAALDNGKTHAANVIAWQRKAENYYRNWQERLNHEKDANLARCDTASAGVPAVLLNPAWVGLYNAAWQPDAAEGYPSRADAEVTEAGPVTPREALDNVAINARLCAEDRKRHDELIDHLMETGAR